MLCPYLSGFLVVLRGLPTAIGRLGVTSIPSRGKVSCVSPVPGIGHGTGSCGGASCSVCCWLFCSGNSWVSFSIGGVTVGGGGTKTAGGGTVHPTTGPGWVSVHLQGVFAVSLLPLSYLVVWVAPLYMELCRRGVHKA